MKSLALWRVAAFALAANALMVLSCSDNSTQPPPPPPPPVHYKSLTEKENLIYNLALCYKEHNLPRYEDLLHPDFMWYNQAGVTPERYTRSEDVEITGNMFLAAENTHPDSTLWLDKLELVVHPGYWQRVSMFNGVACDDCWDTTREYSLVLVMAGGAVIYAANDLVKFVAVPVDLNGIKIYKIIRCDDLPRH